MGYLSQAQLRDEMEDGFVVGVVDGELYDVPCSSKFEQEYYGIGSPRESYPITRRSKREATHKSTRQATQKTTHQASKKAPPRSRRPRKKRASNKRHHHTEQEPSDDEQPALSYPARDSSDDSDLERERKYGYNKDRGNFASGKE